MCATRPAWAQSLADLEPEPHTATSADGTPISYLRVGAGPKSLVIAPGGLDVAEDWIAVASLMADRVTCYPMNRRSRGASGPHRRGHSIDQEIEDILTVVEAVGPGTALLGHSSGGVFALETALREDIENLILYEPAIDYGLEKPPDERQRLFAALTRGLERAAADDLDEALELMLSATGVSDTELAQMRATPIWPVLTTRARAWLGDIEAMAPLSSDIDRLRALSSRTLLITGEVSQAFLRETVGRLDAALSDARVLELPGQGHTANLVMPGLSVSGPTGPALLAEGLSAFLAG